MSSYDTIEGVRRPTTPPASGAAQMREACVAKLTEMANDAERNAENNPGGQFADRKFVAMHAIRIAADAIRTLPLPVDPHAEQIAALTEAAGALNFYAEHVGNCRKNTSEGDASRRLLDYDHGDKAHAALARIDELAKE